MMKIFFSIFFFCLVPITFAYGEEPELLIGDYKLEKFVTGLNVPITLDFIDNDILVLQKNDGQIRLIQNDILQEQPILDLEVSNYGEQGLLGITTNNDKFYLFFTEAHHDGGLSLGNKIYEYTWNGEQVSNPKLLKSLPGWVQGYNAGVMAHDLEKSLFIVSGTQYKFGATQNTSFEDSVNCRTDKKICQDENVVSLSDSIQKTLSCMKVSFFHYTTNPFGHQTIQPEQEKNPMELNPINVITNLGSCFSGFYFDNFSDGNWKDTSVVIELTSESDSYRAIGIRNSFGITVDPITGNLWMTENGPDKFDEINLVEKNFNSGWAKIIGPIYDKNIVSVTPYQDYVYSDPEFSWELPIGITAIDFSPNSFQQSNSLVVADTNHGNIYILKLNENRNGFIFESENLKDLIVNIDPENTYGNFHESMDEIMFGKNFGVITDLKFGPDGKLYVVSIMDGTIYRISPNIDPDI